MKLIKFNAIDSTNTFLKDMADNMLVENYTVILAKQQTSGRGQMHTRWESEPGKNLTCSVFVTLERVPIAKQKFLNFAVALTVYNILDRFAIPNLAIKWPNDIMADGLKICGLLIENTLKGSFIVASVIGIGLNVNQDFRNNGTVKAISMKDILQTNFNLDDLVVAIMEELKVNLHRLQQQDFQELEKEYLKVLFKKNVPSMFKNAKNDIFMGKIIGVSSEGKLQIVLMDETVKEFGLKEVSLLLP